MKKILVVEDNQSVRENLEELLTLSNYKVITAENGKIGVEKALTEIPDLILCDVMMPELDGFGVLHILDKKPATADIPLIFLTAKADKTDFRKGMNLGADDYITKPYDDVELLDAIEMRLKKSERIKKSFDGTVNGLQSFIDEARGQKDLEKLSEERDTRKFRKKDFLYQEGDHPRRLYFVASGQVKVFRTNEAGKEYITQLYKAGDFIGYNALLRDEPYKDAAMVMEDAEINFIPKEDFLALLYNNRNFSARFIKMLANNTNEQEEQLLSLAYNSIRKRVAEALVKLHKHNQEERKTEINILRDDLAGMVGTAKESVIRTLTDFKNEGLISIDNGVISILDAKRLDDMPN
jgi:CheY-like chemotaxis protein